MHGPNMRRVTCLTTSRLSERGEPLRILLWAMALLPLHLIRGADGGAYSAVVALDVDGALRRFVAYLDGEAIGGS
jgi:hypothetical protein